MIEYPRRLQSSYMVHTFSFLTRNLPVKRDGNSSVYAYLGPDYCPVSFLTDENFWKPNNNQEQIQSRNLRPTNFLDLLISRFVINFSKLVEFYYIRVFLYIFIVQLTFNYMCYNWFELKFGNLKFQGSTWLELLEFFYMFL